MGRLDFYCANSPMREALSSDMLTDREWVHLGLQAKHWFSPLAFVAVVLGSCCADMPPKAVVILFDINCISCKHTFTDLMVRTHWWPRILCTTSFSFSEKNTHKMSFAGEDQQNSSPSPWEELNFLSVSCQPNKAWNAVTALYSKPNSYGLAILWLTMYWRFLPLSVELLSNTMDARASAALPCSPVVKRRKMYVYIFSYTEDGKGWGICLILFAFSTGSFSTFHILYHPLSFLALS